MNSTERVRYLAHEGQEEAAGYGPEGAVYLQLLQLFADPGLMTVQCDKALWRAVGVLLGLGLCCRLMLVVAVKVKVMAGMT
jgi:hypothetical protein